MEELSLKAAQLATSAVWLFATRTAILGIKCLLVFATLNAEKVKLTSGHSVRVGLGINLIGNLSAPTSPNL